jgi:hypothetical protein
MEGDVFSRRMKFFFTRHVGMGKPSPAAADACKPLHEKAAARQSRPPHQSIHLE